VSPRHSCRFNDSADGSSNHSPLRRKRRVLAARFFSRRRKSPSKIHVNSRRGDTTNNNGGGGGGGGKKAIARAAGPRKFVTNVTLFGGEGGIHADQDFPNFYRFAVITSRCTRSFCVPPLLPSPPSGPASSLPLCLPAERERVRALFVTQFVR